MKESPPLTQGGQRDMVAYPFIYFGESACKLGSIEVLDCKNGGILEERFVDVNKTM
jgi:hypothetical protein